RSRSWTGRRGAGCSWSTSSSSPRSPSCGARTTARRSRAHIACASTSATAGSRTRWCRVSTGTCAHSCTCGTPTGSCTSAIESPSRSALDVGALTFPSTSAVSVEGRLGRRHEVTMKTREQIERECMAPLPREAVSQRSQGGATLSYVDQHYVINRLCDVLGPLGFETQTLALEAVCEPYKTTTSRGKEVWRVGYRATVRL